MSGEGRVNLLVTIDRTYLQPLKVMLESYRQAHTGVPTTVYVAHDSLTDEELDGLRREADGMDVVGVRIEERGFDGMPVLERLSAVSFYRLLAFSFLPQEVERCLYLDPDIYIRRSLLPLYTLELGENYVAGASHTRGVNNLFNCARLGLRRHGRYINSGVMLLNLAKIRKDFSEERIFAAMRKRARVLFMGDQDLANVLFTQKILFIDELTYNLDERTYKQNKRRFSLSDVEQRTAVIHYNGKHKPWLEGYKGVLNAFYPPVEKRGRVRRFNAFARLKAILMILFLGDQSRRREKHEKCKSTKR